MANGKKSQAAAIEREARRSQALQYRRAGLSIREIASRLNCNHQTVHNDITHALQAAIDENTHSADKLRALELDRLDRMLLGLAPLIYPAGNAPVDLKAMDRAIRIVEQRAKLLGLYAPQLMDIKLSWEDQAIEDIRRGVVTYPALAEAFDESTATRLFAAAGIPAQVTTGEDPE